MKKRKEKKREKHITWPKEQKGLVLILLVCVLSSSICSWMKILVSIVKLGGFSRTGENEKVEGPQGQVWCCRSWKGSKDWAFEFPLYRGNCTISVRVSSLYRDCMKKEREVLWGHSYERAIQSLEGETGFFRYHSLSPGQGSFMDPANSRTRITSGSSII